MIIDIDNNTKVKGHYINTKYDISDLIEKKLSINDIEEEIYFYKDKNICNILAICYNDEIELYVLKYDNKTNVLEYIFYGDVYTTQNKNKYKDIKKYKSFIKHFFGNVNVKDFVEFNNKCTKDKKIFTAVINCLFKKDNDDKITKIKK